MMKYSNEIRIALVAVVGIVVLYLGLQFLKGLTIFSSDNRYFVKFDNISGLSVSSPIYANGYRVGVVEDIIFDYQHNGDITAVVGIDKKMQLPKGSKAEISSDMLGNVKLELVLGAITDGLLAPGDTLRGGMEKGLMGQAATMVPQIQAMLPKLDSILASVNALLADPALAQSLHNVDRITAGLTTTTMELNRLTASISNRINKFTA